MVINDFDELMSKRESVQDINRMLNMNTGELTALVKFCYVLTPVSYTHLTLPTMFEV